MKTDTTPTRAAVDLPRLVLPSSIRVAAFDVAVVEWNHHAATAAGRFGEWSAIECCMRVDPTVNPMKVLDTLLHEINHAIYWSYGMEDEDKEERIVGTMATAWAQIYRDNPKLVSWISDVIHGQNVKAQAPPSGGEGRQQEGGFENCLEAIK